MICELTHETVCSAIEHVGTARRRDVPLQGKIKIGNENENNDTP